MLCCFTERVIIVSLMVKLYLNWRYGRQVATPLLRETSTLCE